MEDSEHFTPSSPVAALIRPDDLLQVGFEVVEQPQHCVGGALAGVAGGSEVVIDTAGERPDAVDPAGRGGEEGKF